MGENDNIIDHNYSPDALQLNIGKLSKYLLEEQEAVKNNEELGVSRIDMSKEWEYVRLMINKIFYSESKEFYFDIEQSLKLIESIISQGTNYKEFHERLKNFDDSQICGLLWNTSYVAYRCRTCGLSSCMSLCSECFLNGNHEGHDYNMFKSNAGGACDCGDPMVLKPNGFCPNHGPNRRRLPAAPNNLTNGMEVIVPHILFTLLRFLRLNVVDYSGSLLNLEKPFRIPILLITDGGSVARSIIGQMLNDSGLYSREREHLIQSHLKRNVPISKLFLLYADGSRMMKVGSVGKDDQTKDDMNEDENMKAISDVESNSETVPSENEILSEVVGMTDNVENTKEEEDDDVMDSQTSKTKKKDVPIKRLPLGYQGQLLNDWKKFSVEVQWSNWFVCPKLLENYSNYIPFHQTMLDEFMWWCFNCDFHETLTAFLLGLLPESDYKNILMTSFTKFYPYSGVLFKNRQLDETKMNDLATRMVHISVQIFSNSQVIGECLNEKMNILYQIIIAVWYILMIDGRKLYEKLKNVKEIPSDGILVPLKLFHDWESGTPLHFNANHIVLEKNYMWPIISDMINVLNHQNACEWFMNDEIIQTIWIDFIAYFNGMNVNIRSLDQHVERESREYCCSFSAELQNCCAPLWTLVHYLNNLDLSIEYNLHNYTRYVRLIVARLRDWLISCKLLKFQRKPLNPETETIITGSGSFRYNGRISENSYDNDEYRFSFHIPLHRSLSILLFTLMSKSKKDDIKSIILSTFGVLLNEEKCHERQPCDSMLIVNEAVRDDMMESLDVYSEWSEEHKELTDAIMYHSIGCWIGYSEIISNLWTKNGIQMKSQAITYIHPHFCASIADADLFLIQTLCLEPTRSLEEKSKFLENLFKRFHLHEIITLSEARNIGIQRTYGRIHQEKGREMIEQFLLFISYFTFIVPNLHIQDYEATRREVIAILAMDQRTYSQIEDLLPDTCVVSDSKKYLSEVLEEVADFHYASQKTQGTYSLKNDIWIDEYDPIFVRLRSSYKRYFQESVNNYEKAIRHVRSSEWSKDDINNMNVPWIPYRPYLPSTSFGNRRRNLIEFISSKSFMSITAMILYMHNESIMKLNEYTLALLIHLIGTVVDYNEKTPLLFETKTPEHISDDDDGAKEEILIFDRPTTWFPHATSLLEILFTPLHVIRLFEVDEDMDLENDLNSEETESNCDAEMKVVYDFTRFTTDELKLQVNMGPEVEDILLQGKPYFYDYHTTRRLRINEINLFGISIFELICCLYEQLEKTVNINYLDNSNKIASRSIHRIRNHQCGNGKANVASLLLRIKDYAEKYNSHIHKKVTDRLDGISNKYHPKTDHKIRTKLAKIFKIDQPPNLDEMKDGKSLASEAFSSINLDRQPSAIEVNKKIERRQKMMNKIKASQNKFMFNCVKEGKNEKEEKKERTEVQQKIIERGVHISHLSSIIDSDKEEPQTLPTTTETISSLPIPSGNDDKCCICFMNNGQPLGLLCYATTSSLLSFREPNECFGNEIIMERAALPLSESSLQSVPSNCRELMKMNGPPPHHDLKYAAHESRRFSILRHLYGKNGVYSVNYLGALENFYYVTCGHVFHSICLKSYTQSIRFRSSYTIAARELQCPTCRQLSNKLLLLPSSLPYVACERFIGDPFRYTHRSRTHSQLKDSLKDNIGSNSGKEFEIKSSKYSGKITLKTSTKTGGSLRSGTKEDLEMNVNNSAQEIQEEDEEQMEEKIEKEEIEEKIEEEEIEDKIEEEELEEMEEEEEKEKVSGRYSKDKYSNEYPIEESLGELEKISNEESLKNSGKYGEDQSPKTLEEEEKEGSLKSSLKKEKEELSKKSDEVTKSSRKDSKKNKNLNKVKTIFDVLDDDEVMQLQMLLQLTKNYDDISSKDQYFADKRNDISIPINFADSDVLEMLPNYYKTQNKNLFTIDQTDITSHFEECMKILLDLGNVRRSLETYTKNLSTPEHRDIILLPAALRSQLEFILQNQRSVTSVLPTLLHLLINLHKHLEEKSSFIRPFNIILSLNPHLVPYRPTVNQSSKYPDLVSMYIDLAPMDFDEKFHLAEPIFHYWLLKEGDDVEGIRMIQRLLSLHARRHPIRRRVNCLWLDPIMTTLYFLLASLHPNVTDERAKRNNIFMFKYFLKLVFASVQAQAIVSFIVAGLYGEHNNENNNDKKFDDHLQILFNIAFDQFKHDPKNHLKDDEFSINNFLLNSMEFSNRKDIPPNLSKTFNFSQLSHIDYLQKRCMSFLRMMVALYYEGITQLNVVKENYYQHLLNNATFNELCEEMDLQNHNYFQPLKTIELKKNFESFLHRFKRWTKNLNKTFVDLHWSDLERYVDVPTDSGKSPDHCIAPNWLERQIFSRSLTLSKIWQEDKLKIESRLKKQFILLCLSCPTLNWRKAKLLKLPELYSQMFQEFYKIKCIFCQQERSDETYVCLVCGEAFQNKNCCTAMDLRKARHLSGCGSSCMIYLDIMSTRVKVVRSQTYLYLWSSLYLDEHFEEDKLLKRGKPLYLDNKRFELLEENWQQHKLHITTPDTYASLWPKQDDFAGRRLDFTAMQQDLRNLIDNDPFEEVSDDEEL
ncbi:hypothetical protein SNEBB_004756 [Seison nebaliae]|nr:hypothetical protein SNEBB_004756 [Seison nebaliae]